MIGGRMEFDGRLRENLFIFFQRTAIYRCLSEFSVFHEGPTSIEGRYDESIKPLKNPQFKNICSKKHLDAVGKG